MTSYYAKVLSDNKRRRQKIQAMGAERTKEGKRRFTQDDLAKVFGVTRQRIQQILKEGK